MWGEAERFDKYNISPSSICISVCQPLDLAIKIIIFYDEHPASVPQAHIRASYNKWRPTWSCKFVAMITTFNYVGNANKLKKTT